MMAAEMVRVLMAKLGFRSVDELIGHAKVSCEESASRVGSLLFSPKLLPAHYLPTFTVLCQLCRVSHSLGGFDASGCVWLSGCWLCVPLGWGDSLSTPQVQRLPLHEPWLLRTNRDCTPALFLTSSVCTSMSLCSSEEEGLAPLPSSSQCRGVLRRRRDRPSSSQFRRVLRRARDRPSSSQCRCVRRLLAGCADQPSQGVAPYARVYEVDRRQDQRQSGRFGDTFRLGRNGAMHVGTLRRHHGLWDGLRLAHGCRSVLLGTLCDTMR